MIRVQSINLHLIQCEKKSLVPGHSCQRTQHYLGKWMLQGPNNHLLEPIEHNSSSLCSCTFSQKDNIDALSSSLDIILLHLVSDSNCIAAWIWIKEEERITWEPDVLNTVAECGADDTRCTCPFSLSEWLSMPFELLSIEEYALPQPCSDVLSDELASKLVTNLYWKPHSMYIFHRSPKCERSMTRIHRILCIQTSVYLFVHVLKLPIINDTFQRTIVHEQNLLPSVQLFAAHRACWWSTCVQPLFNWVSIIGHRGLH